MATIDAVRIKNLRSLVDTDWIDQKPITVLVGKNSAGKSTFARSFPLLRQSVGERKQSPILWFGQYVDFGQHSVAVYNKTPTAAISFGFKLKLSAHEIQKRNALNLYTSRLRNNVDQDSQFPVEVEISLVGGSEADAADTVADKLTINALGFVVTVQFSTGGVENLSIDGRQIWQSKSKSYCHVEFNSALPKLTFFKERNATPEEQIAVGGGVLLEEDDPFSRILISEVRQHVHGNLGDEKVNRIAARLALGNDEYFYQQARIAGGDQRLWIDYINTSPKNLKRAVLCARLPELIRVLDATISAHFGAVKYIEPLRATAQRYYRKQDLAINELDAKGANVAQFLQGLPLWRRNEFDAVTKRLFGFTVQPRAQGGHIELVLEHTNGGGLVNLADAGVGFSQMLPILLQFWASDNTRSFHQTRLSASTPTTLVVEQPELHLHPAYQATGAVRVKY